MVCVCSEEGDVVRVFVVILNRWDDFFVWFDSILEYSFGIWFSVEFYDIIMEELV